MTKRLITVLATALFATQAFAWSDAGHGAIARIAYRHLTPEVRAKVNVLLKVGVEKRYHSVHMASYWADEYRSDHPETGPWHYTNIHFRTDGRITHNKPLEENVSWAVSKFRKELGDKSLSQYKRAEVFRFLVHFVGDAHQPLHCVARDTNRFPNGDRGGNDFAITPGNGLPSWNTNLHRVWDSGCGAFDVGMRGWDTGAGVRIDALSKKIEAAYPKTLLASEISTLNPESWAKSGFNIAKTFAYTAPEGGTPSRNYVRRGQEISMRQAALAGYRLAEILNEALAD